MNQRNTAALPFIGSITWLQHGAKDAAITTSISSSTQIEGDIQTISIEATSEEISDSSIIKTLDKGAMAYVTASSWVGKILVNEVSTMPKEAMVFLSHQAPRQEATQSGSLIQGGKNNDLIRGFWGWDILNGGAGDDLIRAGNGRDIITGGPGSDELHGDFGRNTYTGERDGSIDLIAIKSDQHLVNWWYGQAGNNPNGEKADILEGLDPFDQIKIIGVATEAITFRSATVHGLSGIGIFAEGTIEALYIGGDLSVSQLQTMTTGDNSPAAMANQLWSYWHGNTMPEVLG